MKSRSAARSLLCCVWLASGIVGGVAAPALAQDTTSPDAGARAPDAGAPAGVVVPELVEFVHAEYPPDAHAAGVTGDVVLVLTIGADGAVRDATVGTSSGHASLDAAAVAAGRRFRFRPATRAGRPIAARIRYRYEFRLEEAPRTGDLVGAIRWSDGGAIGGLTVVAIGPGESRVERSARTDARGRFAFERLEPGRYDVRISGGGMPTRGYRETVRPGEATDLVYRFEHPTPRPSADAGAQEQDTEYESVTVAERPPREVTRRTVEREEIRRIPGTRGDALRAIEILPGVARPPAGVGLLIVRGSAPRDSEVLMEGVQVPLLYHFGGLTSFINTTMLERIDFYPGNFSARYGQHIGGVIDIAPRDPRTDRFHGVADVSLIDASVMLEGPIGSHGGFFVGARRSYVDFFLDAFIPDDVGSIIAAPVYYDYQALAQYRLTPRDRLRLFVYGSSDRFEFLIKQPSDEDPTIRGDASLSTQFHRVQLSWLHRPRHGSELELLCGVGYNAAAVSIARDLSFDFDVIPIVTRGEWRQRLSDRARIIAGIDFWSADARGGFRGPPPQQTEGVVLSDLGAQPVSQIHVHPFFWRPGAYLEAELLPTPALRLVPGVRVDYYSDLDRFSVDPRLAARLELDPRTFLKAGVGQYSQPPQFQEVEPSIGNPGLRPIEATHYGFGIERDLATDLRITAEGFFKTIRNLTVNPPPGQEELRFVDEGIGRIYGFELSIRHGARGPLRGFTGLLSYTLSRSERRDHPQSDWRLFDFDQTHILSIVLGYDLGHGWDVGVRFRLVSGNPDTPFVGSIYNARTNLYSPLPGLINSTRLPPFHQLDVRIAKRWRFSGWSLEVYLDVQNAYNHGNVEGYQYSYDFRQRSEVTGLPIIPSLGVRGEL